ncbi:uncharacterized protein TNCV_4755741 [Trichonephila clavipes]|nr:uncharacterized protein TNCV_4755741 [Trichonephila clavipes]
MKLCDKDLLNKCLHGKTQNANESFNGILWKFIPKDIFVELQTLKLGAHMAVIQFNKGFRRLLDVLNQAQIQVGVNTVSGFAQLDEERINESKRHSLSERTEEAIRALGHHLGGKSFHDDDEIKDEVEMWFRQQAATFYDCGIQKLVHRRNKCWDNRDEHVEK